MRPGEDIEKYIDYQRRMNQRLNLPPKDRLHLFIQNLKPALQEYVILGNPKNYDEAERLARLKRYTSNKNPIPLKYCYTSNKNPIPLKYQEEP